MQHRCKGHPWRGALPGKRGSPEATDHLGVSGWSRTPDRLWQREQPSRPALQD